MQEPLPPRPPGFYNSGTSFAGQKWCALLYHASKKHYVGSFIKQEAAAEEAYDSAARHLKGQNAARNFGSTEEGDVAASLLPSSGRDHVHKAAHMKPRPKSGFYGVTANKNKWAALLYHDNQEHYLGSFNTKQEAAVCYDKAARHFKGQNAACNFGSTEEGDVAASLALSEWEREHPVAAAAQDKQLVRILKSLRGAAAVAEILPLALTPSVRQSDSTRTTSSTTTTRRRTTSSNSSIGHCHACSSADLLNVGFPRTPLRFAETSLAVHDIYYRSAKSQKQNVRKHQHHHRFEL
jgi:hypothetical protein